VTDYRTSPRLIRRGLLAAVVACAWAGPINAEPLPSRDYPPSYSSKKSPWYDPFSIFTSSEKKADVPVVQHESKPVSNEMIEGALGTAPAWKWYGYGTPTPGRNPLAPNGSYAPVPVNWHTTSGATPGAIPSGRIGPNVIPDPTPTPRIPAGPATSIAVLPPDGPVAPPIESPRENIDWKTSSATLRLPTAETEGPRATLKAPVHDDVPTTPMPSTPLQREVPTGSDARDIPVEAAPGIVVPSGGLSQASGRITARAVAPTAELPAAAIRRACGPDVRVMEISPVGTKRMVIRMAATMEAAIAARERLSRLTELRGWRVDFELVTPLQK
jgi:hypothetical protein